MQATTTNLRHSRLNGKKIFLPLAILLHMLADTFPGLYQRGVVPLWTVEGWAAVWVLVILLIAGKLYSSA